MLKPLGLCNLSVDNVCFCDKKYALIRPRFDIQTTKQLSKAVPFKVIHWYPS